MATTQEAIRKLTVVSEERGVEQTTEKLNRYSRAHLQLVDATGQSERATAAMEKRLQASSREYEKNAKLTREISKSQDALAQQMAVTGQASMSAANDNFRVTESQKNVAVAAVEVAIRLGAVAAVLGQFPGPIGTAVRALAALRFALSTTAVGIAGVVALGITAVPAFAAWEQQMLTIEQVIRATGGAAGRTAADLDELENSLSKSTLAGGDDLKQAQAQLLTFRSIAGDTFDRALKAAVDLSAVGFGSVQQSAVQLAKALEDPEQGLSALRRVGVSFSATQREMIRNFVETGRVVEAQRVVLEAIEQQVGGAGAAQASGLSGSFHYLTENVGDFFEAMGGILGRGAALERVLRSIGNAIGVINRGLEANSRLRAAADELVSLPFTLQSPGRLGLRVARGLFGSSNEEGDAEQDRAAIEERARKAREQAATERYEGEIYNLEKEREALRRTELQRQQYEAVKRAGAAGDSARIAVIEEEVRKNYELAESMKAQERAASDSLRERKRLARIVPEAVAGIEEEIRALEIQQATIGMSTRAAARYRTEQSLLNEARAAGIALSPAERESVSRLSDQYAEQVVQLEAMERQFQSLEDVARSVTDGMGRAFDEFIQTGRVNFSSFVDGLLADIARIAFTQAIGDPLTEGLTSVLTGLVGPAGATATLFHDGGVVGSGGRSRRVHPAYFDDAPRYHGGGIAGLRPNEVPAILERGERVVPRGEGFAAPRITIVNNTSAKIDKAEARPAGGGRPGRDWMIELGEVTAKEIRRSGSAPNLAVQGLGGRAPIRER